MTNEESVNNDEWLEVDCLTVTQPIGSFYVATMNAKDAVRLSFSDPRRISTESREVEKYLGLERPLNKKRVKDIKEYVSLSDATFPSAVIFAVDAENANYDEGARKLVLRDKPGIAKILDGQHRLAGLHDYDAPFQLIVTIFLDMDIEDQAILFATINLEQTKVNKSLAYDLFDLAKSKSPQKSAHNIVVLLDTEQESPLRNKIKRLGVAQDAGETLSQAVVVEALLKLISTNPMKDRDLLRRGKEPERATAADEERGLIFRNLFLDGKDEIIAGQLWDFFDAVRDRWTEAWTEPVRGVVLNRTTGLRALMQFLPYAYRATKSQDSLPQKAQYRGLLDRVDLEDGDFNTEEFKPGTGGESALRRRLLADTGLG